MKHSLLGAAALVFTIAAGTAAQAQTADLHPFVGLALTGGGKTLATVRYTNGDSQNIKSGGLYQIKGGIDFHPVGSAFALQASIGYHADETNARNGRVTFSRYPVELLAFFHPNEQFRIGGGLRYATNARLKSTGRAENLGNYDLDGQAGAVIEGEYRFARHFGLMVRAVDEKYKDPTGKRIDGSHVGVGMNFYW